MIRRCFFAAAAFVISAVFAFSESGERQVTRLADGVYAIQHKVLHDGNPSGNTTVIIGDRQVFVVDSTYRPSLAREDIAQIRQWTDKPVAYLLNTHFHDDHHNGNKTYMDAFPALAIIAHDETKRDMDLIEPGNVERTPKDDKKEVEQILPGLEQAQSEFQTLVYQPPTLTFSDTLDIDIGNREVQVKHLGRGNTPGDAVVYLPKEKVLVAGDLLVYPIPYTYDGYPTEWIETLQKMAQLEAQTIVPGHGPVLHDTTYLYLVMDLMKSAVAQVRARIRHIGFPGAHSLDEVKDSVELTPFRAKFAGDDKDLQAEFDDMTAHLVKLVFNEAALR
jgi:cyclase